ncbi:hypothetical protein E4T66_06580 [Sinimarinibacterium sp. CAU 1509]|uniref:hypothetical protein n=1 Tax=Sinimarinibacterium sp. CAU 1509 TaxID=2562283 RepID=UPI0010AC2BB8|nr:hypothetical protein [Sinimarinibacterium sp. CAU 1509]TJY61909.1 hypothetical protein E4T66_06580 [Sinimarinibacterium sp. CAU 1509]
MASAHWESDLAKLQRELQRLALFPCRVLMSGTSEHAELAVDFGLGVEPLHALPAAEWLDVHRDWDGAMRLAAALQQLPAQVPRDALQLSTQPLPM